ncbi:hypothetical protein [Hymenobacter wooponensis]|uniref:hypothetical protein n=1 Tax=Hymenobacter wooponensis TaxID=1525360 RepID=UPI001436A951|nr:hypothetical protein [Hymenobacter wooponensis]
MGAVLGDGAVATGFLFKDAAGVLAPYGEALQREVGQDGTGGFADCGWGQFERGPLVVS